MQQLIIVTMLSSSLLHAMNKVFPYEEELSDTSEFPVEVLAFVGTFVKERELFILERWHKNPEDRKYILETSSDEKKNK